MSPQPHGVDRLEMAVIDAQGNTIVPFRFLTDCNYNYIIIINKQNAKWYENINNKKI